MARPNTTEDQALRQLGGAEEDSRYRDSDRHLRLLYDEEEKRDAWCTGSSSFVG